MKRDSFFRDSVVLTFSNLATGILGFIFTILLSRTLGAEGMGVYGLVMPIYNLFICLISGGMVAAMSKVSANYFAISDYGNLNSSIRTSIKFDFIWGTFICIIVFFMSGIIGTNFIRDSRTIYALKVICPAMIFVALSSILKGYFYGVSKVHIPAIIDIFEKAIRIVVILAIIHIFTLKEVDNTVTAAYIALAIGELISLLFLYLFYLSSKRKLSGGYTKHERKSQLLFNVLAISFPLCLTGFLSTALGTVSTLMIPRRLIASGLNYSVALSMIGKFTGMALTIVFFPLLIIHSMSTVLIPDLSQALSKKDYFALESRIATVLKIAFILGLSTMLICLTIPDSLGILFFKRKDLASYISFCAFCAPITYISATTFGILNGLGKQGVILRNSLIVSVEELILLYFLTAIPSINIYGYGISIIVTSFTALILNIYEIRKKCYFNIEIAQIIIYILLSILLFFVLNLIKQVIPSNMMIVETILVILTGFSLFTLAIIRKDSV